MRSSEVWGIVPHVAKLQQKRRSPRTSGQCAAVAIYSHLAKTQGYGWHGLCNVSTARTGDNMSDTLARTWSKADLREVMRSIKALPNSDERLALLIVVVSALVRRLPDEYEADLGTLRTHYGWSLEDAEPSTGTDQ